MRATLVVLGALLAVGCKKAPPETVTVPAPAPEVAMPEPRAAPAAEPAAPVRIAFETAYFDYDSSALRPDVLVALDGNVKVLQANPEMRVTLEGHCDERGTTEYNLALGDRRAATVERYLVSAGIAATRLDTVSYGEERPLAFGHDETAWAQNRRVEFVVPGGLGPVAGR